MLHYTFDEGLPTDPDLRQVASEIIPKVLEYYPFWATGIGIHVWDDRMPPTDPVEREQFVLALESALQQIDNIPTHGLSQDDLADYLVLKGQLRAMWLDETRDHPEAHDPNLWNSMISASLLPLARQDYAPLEVRAAYAAARMRQVPRLLQTARTLLDNPPALFVEVAISQFESTIPLLTDMIPAAFDAVDDDVVRSDVQAAGLVAGEAYEAFVTFLKDELLPRAHGDFRLGADRYAEKLSLTELVTSPLTDLLQRGYDELHRLQAAFSSTAHVIGPDLSVHQVLARVGRDHPPAEQLLSYVSGVLGELERFCRDRNLVPIPASNPPQVVETPAFMRMTTFASIDPPGPFAEKSTDAYYQVTLPDDTWSSKDIESHLRGYNRWATRIISAHEVFPGHFVQFLHFPRSHSTIRKVFWSNAFVEGWAHYIEEVMVEEGYGASEPEMRFMQLMEALERVGRFIVGIRLHTEGMSVDQAQDFFEKECFMESVNARREALRGTMDPFYLIYTLGKLEIMRLREIARERDGVRFQLGSFHESLLSHGAPPLPVLEQLIFNAP